MNDAELRELLNRLPRRSASPRFTRDVLGKVRRPAPQRSGWRLAAATVVSICLVLVVAHAVTARVDRERLRALRAEHHSIESELQQVKAIAEHPQPVVVLENDDTRMTVDVADHRAAGDQPLQPVVY